MKGVIAYFIFCAIFGVVLAICGISFLMWQYWLIYLSVHLAIMIIRVLDRIDIQGEVIDKLESIEVKQLPEKAEEVYNFESTTYNKKPYVWKSK